MNDWGFIVREMLGSGHTTATHEPDACPQLNDTDVIEGEVVNPPDTATKVTQTIQDTLRKIP